MSKDENREPVKPDTSGQAIKVTVFTPTYNRRHTLGRVYRSLREQTFRDFEWLIVDDGSTDDTESLVKEWQKEENFCPVRYFWKPNGGKHTAHNLGISLASGEYFAILDSDDWYAPDALAEMVHQWGLLQEKGLKGQFSNVEGLSCNAGGSIVGHEFPADIYDGNFLEMQQTHNFDTRGMYRLDVLRAYPFPEGYDSCFVTESLIWNRIAQKYRTRYMNKIVGFTEYQADGLTNRSFLSRCRNTEPAILYNRELSAIKVFPLPKRLKGRINAYRYSFHNRLPIRKQLSDGMFRVSNVLFLTIGYIAYLKDRLAVMREERHI